jgi:hypothetical protein
MKQWYYIKDKNRMGPISDQEFKTLVKSLVIAPDTFVWCKGFPTWIKLRDIPEWSSMKNKIDWNTFPRDERLITVKVGMDRNQQESVYGPFSLNMLIRLFEDGRINAKTLLYAPGMDSWVFLADIPIYQTLFSKIPPVIDEKERRLNARRPFTASVFFHDNTSIYEGVCRDISVGGLQILVADYPGNINDRISINVHPENSDQSFVAEGIIVRKFGHNQGVSVRFTNLSNEAKDAIGIYLKEE